MKFCPGCGREQLSEQSPSAVSAPQKTVQNSVQESSPQTGIEKAKVITGAGGQSPQAQQTPSVSAPPQQWPGVSAPPQQWPGVSAPPQQRAGMSAPTQPQQPNPSETPPVFAPPHPGVQMNPQWPQQTSPELLHLLSLWQQQQAAGFNLQAAGNPQPQNPQFKNQPQNWPGFEKGQNNPSSLPPPMQPVPTGQPRVQPPPSQPGPNNLPPPMQPVPTGQPRAQPPLSQPGGKSWESFEKEHLGSPKNSYHQPLKPETQQERLGGAESHKSHPPHHQSPQSLQGSGMVQSSGEQLQLTSQHPLATEHFPTGSGNSGGSAKQITQSAGRPQDTRKLDDTVTGKGGLSGSDSTKDRGNSKPTGGTTELGSTAGKDGDGKKPASTGAGGLPSTIKPGSTADKNKDGSTADKNKDGKKPASTGAGGVPSATEPGSTANKNKDEKKPASTGAQQWNAPSYATATAKGSSTQASSSTENVGKL